MCTVKCATLCMLSYFTMYSFEPFYYYQKCGSCDFPDKSEQFFSLITKI